MPCSQYVYWFIPSNASQCSYVGIACTITPLKQWHIMQTADVVIHHHGLPLLPPNTPVPHYIWAHRYFFMHWQKIGLRAEYYRAAAVLRLYGIVGRCMVIMCATHAHAPLPNHPNTCDPGVATTLSIDYHSTRFEIVIQSESLCHT